LVGLNTILIDYAKSSPFFIAGIIITAIVASVLRT